MTWKRTLAVLGFGVCLAGASYTMIVPFLPLYLIDLGVGEAGINLWSGVIFAATFLVSGLLSPYWGRQADRTGKRRMVIRSGLSLAAVYFLGALVRTPGELLVMRVFQGIAVGFVPTSMAIASSIVPAEKIGVSLGFLQGCNLIGTIVGPAAGGLLAHLFGIRTSFEVGAAVIFLATLGVWLLVPEPPCLPVDAAGSVAGDLRAALGNPPVRQMLALTFLVQMVAIMLQPLITVYIAELQASYEGISLLAGGVFSLAGLAGAIAAPLWGKAGQKCGFIGTVGIAFAGAGLALAAAFFSRQIVSFAALYFAFGLFMAGAYPNINGMIVTCTDEAFRGRAFGLVMSANQFGAMTGPLIGGAVSTLIGIRPIFALDGLLFLLAGAVLLRRHPPARQS